MLLLGRDCKDGCETWQQPDSSLRTGCLGFVAARPNSHASIFELEAATQQALLTAFKATAQQASVTVHRLLHHFLYATVFLCSQIFKSVHLSCGVWCCAAKQGDGQVRQVGSLPYSPRGLTSPQLLWASLKGCCQQPYSSPGRFQPALQPKPRSGPHHCQLEQLQRRCTAWFKFRQHLQHILSTVTSCTRQMAGLHTDAQTKASATSSWFWTTAR